MTIERALDELSKASSRTMMGRELVPLKEGEMAPRAFSVWQPPPGYRWERDEEFAAREAAEKAAR